MCFQFMTTDLRADNCVAYWNLAQEFNQDELKQSCSDLFMKEFQNVASACSIEQILEDMMFVALNEDDLNVDTEYDDMFQQSYQTRGLSSLHITIRPF